MKCMCLKTLFIVLIIINNKRTISYECISDAESKYISSFKNDNEKKKHYYTLIIPKILYALLFNKKISEIEICRSSNGKPYVKGNYGLKFNCSHSGNYVVVAFYGNRIGIDMEIIGEYNEAIVNKYFTSEEQLLLNKNNNKISFFDIWTKKESFLKFKGLNLSDLKKINICKKKYITYIIDNMIINVYLKGKVYYNKICIIDEDLLLDKK